MITLAKEFNVTHFVTGFVVHLQESPDSKSRSLTNKSRSLSRLRPMRTTRTHMGSAYRYRPF